MSEIIWAFPTMIARTAVRDTVKQLCIYFSGEAASGMFEVPVYKDGELYGYISSGAVDSGFMPTMTNPARLAQDAGITLEQATSILSQCHVGGSDWVAVLDGLGLTIESTLYGEKGS